MNYHYLQRKLNESYSPKTHQTIYGRTHGKATKDRNLEPSMFQLLTWNGETATEADLKRIKESGQFHKACPQRRQQELWRIDDKQDYGPFNNSKQINEQSLIRRGNCADGKQPIYSNHHHAKITDKTLNDKIQMRNDNSPKVKMIGRAVSPIPPRKHITDAQYRSLSPQNNTTIKQSLKCNSIKQAEQQQQQGQLRQQRQQKQRDRMIQKFKQTTRWIPNSAFTTYFGKPPFQNYGYKNINPTQGGLIYGSYLYSHNVHPHRGNNSPQSLQSYPVALAKAKSQGTLIPTVPKTKNNLTNSLYNTEFNDKINAQKIYPQPNDIGKLDIQVPDLNEIEKFALPMSPTNKSTTQEQRHKCTILDYKPKKQYKKKKGKKNAKKKVKSDDLKYEEWIALKQQQRNVPMAKLQVQNKIVGRRIHY